METHFRATERHLPYGITVTVLPATRQQSGRPVRLLDSPTPEGWKAESTLVVLYMPTSMT